MRILAVSNYFPPYFRGGFEISASIMCKSLVEKGHEVDVLTTQDPPAEGDVSAGFSVHRILEDRHRLEKIEQLPARLHGWAAVNAEFRNGSVNRRIVQAFLSGRSYDVAILFNLARVGTSLAHALAAKSIPTLWCFGDYWHIERRNVGSTGKLARINRKLWSRRAVEEELSTPIVFAAFNSDFLRNRYLDAGFNPVESWVIHRSCPVQPNVLPYSFQHRQHSFVVTSQVEHHKGIHIVLQAAKMLNDSNTGLDWRIDIFGSGNDSYLKEVEKLRQSSGLQDRVLFHGKRPHSEVLQAVKTSLALIHPAIWDEPFGRVAIEAMACNTPLISADTGAIFEITDTSSSLIYQRHDASELARIMQAILEDESLGQRCAAAGLAIHRQRFTPEIECERLEGVLEHIALSRAT